MGPLDGLRAVELAGIGPVPYAGMLLADLGADVVRVDRAGGDRPRVPHRILDRGRRSVALDLKRPAAVEAVLRLAGGAPFYAVYPCADGRYVAVGAIEEPFWRALLAGLGLDPAQLPDRADPASWPALRATVAQRFATRERDAWLAVFGDGDACVTAVLTLPEAMAHPQAGRSFVGGEPVPAPRFSRTPGAVGRSAPVPGEHTREVLAECGLSLDDI